MKRSSATRWSRAICQSRPCNLYIMDNTEKVPPLRLSVYMTGDPARRIRQLSTEKDMSRNQVVRSAINRWGRIEELMPDPTDQLFVRKADGTEIFVRF